MKYLILSAVLMLVGCQAMMEEQRRQMSILCTYDGAYSKGVEHAENQEGSQAMQTFSGCESAEEALRGYNDGYASVNAKDNSIGGLIGQVIDSSGGSAYSCEIEVFTKTVSAKGRTRSEALYNAKKRCAASRHDGDFFCKNSSEYQCEKLY